MWLRRILWQSLSYHDFSWASAVLMQSKLKQWKQQQTTANLGLDKSEQQERSATWRHDDRLRHMIAWSMMIYKMWLCDMWYVIWCPSSRNAFSNANATLCVGLYLACGQPLTGKCNVKMDPIISSLLNIINESFLKHGCSWSHWGITRLATAVSRYSTTPTNAMDAGFARPTTMAWPCLYRATLPILSTAST